MSERLPAGTLRHRIRLQQQVDELNSDGEPIDGAWADVFDGLIPAEIVTLAGRELVAAAAISSKATTRITIRRRFGVVASMRAVEVTIDGGDVFNIEAVVPDPDSRRRRLRLLCSSGTNLG